MLKTHFFSFSLTSSLKLPGFMIGMCLLSVSAMAQEVASGMAQGQQAFEEGRFAEAAQAFESVLSQTPDASEAHYMLARIYLETSLLDASKASDHYGKALKRDPQNERYLELRLYRWVEHPPWRPPPVLVEMQDRYARKLLELHPMNALAHRQLGTSLYKQFEQTYHRVGFSLQDEGRAPYTYEPELVETDSGAVLEYTTRQGDIVPYIRKRAGAIEAYEKAVEHLRQAIAADSSDAEAYRTLMRAFVLSKRYDEALAMLRAVPPPFRDSTNYKLYLGLAQWQLNQLAAAEQSFSDALEQMLPSERAAFEDIDTFLGEQEQQQYKADSSAFSTGFWAARDPWFLSPINERKLEHYARLVIADLRYGDDEKRGWNVAPGQVVVRYGEPIAEGSRRNDFESYLDVHYGDLKFRFMQITPFADPIYYSPPADAFSGLRSRIEVWDNDYVQKSKEIFREIPERSAYKLDGTKIAVPFLVSSFKGDQGRAEVYISFGVRMPTRRVFEDLPLGIETGVFLIDPLSGMADRQQEQLSLLSADRIHDVGEEVYWLGLAHLVSEPGLKQVAVEFQTGTAGIIGAERAIVEVPVFKAGDLAVSDLMLAYDVEEMDTPQEIPGHVLRKDVLIEPALSNRFAIDQPLYFYFEMYNLAQEAGGTTRYEMEAALVEKKSEGRGLERHIRRALQGRQRGSVSVRFDEQGFTSDEGRYLILDTSEQDPGTYLLVLRVRDAVSGQEVETRREVQVVK